MPRPLRHRLLGSARWVVLGLVIFVAGGFAGHRLLGDPGFELFQDVLGTIHSQALDSVGVGDLYEIAARGMVGQLGDPYAALFSPEEMKAFSRDAIGDRYEGLGMEVGSEEGGTVIVRVFSPGPAATVGLQPGDLIVEVDGEDTNGWEPDRVTKRLRGPAGTDVSLAVERPGVDAPIRMNATRAAVHVPAVPFAVLLDGGVGYVPLQTFNQTARAELASALVKLRAEGADRFVLDLRGNPGGHLDQAIQVASLFLDPNEPVVRVEARTEDGVTYGAPHGSGVFTEPLAVLIDGRTASAAEIVAGALQDHDRALLVGQRSFGKGVVQDVVPLRHGWVIKLTTARWLTPSGRQIQKAPTNTRLAAMDSGVVAPPARTAFASDAGRRLEGGGGIVPDSVAAADTLSTPEQALLKRVADHFGDLSTAMLAMARQLQADGAITPDWHATAAQIEALRVQLADAGVAVDRAEWDAGEPLIRRLLERRVLTLGLGDAAAFRRGATADAQLGEAMRLLRASQSAEQLLGMN